MENKGKTWSRGTNSRLPFGVNVNLNLSIVKVLTYLSLFLDPFKQCINKSR